MATRKKAIRTGSFSVRVEPELRAAIEAEAEKERRPMCNLVRKVLAERFMPKASHGEQAIGMGS